MPRRASRKLPTWSPARRASASMRSPHRSRASRFAVSVLPTRARRAIRARRCSSTRSILADRRQWLSMPSTCSGSRSSRGRRAHFSGATSWAVRSTSSPTARNRAFSRPAPNSPMATTIASTGPGSSICPSATGAPQCARAPLTVRTTAMFTTRPSTGTSTRRTGSVDGSSSSPSRPMRCVFTSPWMARGIAIRARSRVFSSSTPTIRSPQPTPSTRIAMSSTARQKAFRISTRSACAAKSTGTCPLRR